MAEFKDSQRKEQLVPVIKRYREEGRHDDTYTAERLPPGKRRDFMPRVKRKNVSDED